MRSLNLLIVLLMFVLIATGCQVSPESPSTNGGTTETAADEKDRVAAEKKLQDMLDAKKRQAEFGEAQRKLEEEREARRQAEAARPHYSPAELAAAARPRTWASITVGLECEGSSQQHLA